MIKKFSKEAIKSTKIGSFCISAYLVCYTLRHSLSVVAPIMVQSGICSKEHLGTLSSIYMALYAIGQLVNGILGDKFKPKTMICTGCLLAGAGMCIFPLINARILHYICFAVLGFGLSMLRGPMMKVITDNTPQAHARTICVLFSAASFAGPLIASLLSVIFSWNYVFFAISAFAFTVAVISFLFLGYSEKKNEIVFIRHDSNLLSGLKNLTKVPKFLFYLIVGGAVEIVASTVNFWIPTYLCECLYVSEATAATIYSAFSLATLPCPFICVFLYYKFKGDDVSLVGILFAISTVTMALLPFTRFNAILNIALLCISKLGVYTASAALWSLFIPSLSKYGCVSSGNGVYDFAGYACASVAGIFSAVAVSLIGWTNLIIVWAGICGTVVIAAIVYKIYYAKR